MSYSWKSLEGYPWSQLWWQAGLDCRFHVTSLFMLWDHTYNILSPAVRSQVCKYQWLNNNFPPSCHLYQNFLFNNISNEVYSHTLFLCGTKWCEYICIDGVLCCACIHCFDFLVEQRMSFTLETPNVKFQDISITKLIVWCLSMVLGTWN